jgi:hypothetical protein
MRLCYCVIRERISTFMCKPMRLTAEGWGKYKWSIVQLNLLNCIWHSRGSNEKPARLFENTLITKGLSSGTWRHVVRYKCTDVSENPAVSAIKIDTLIVGTLIMAEAGTLRLLHFYRTTPSHIPGDMAYVFTVSSKIWKNKICGWIINIFSCRLIIYSVFECYLWNIYNPLAILWRSIRQNVTEARAEIHSFYY